MSYAYTSNFGKHIEDLFIQKRSVGFKYNTTAEYYFNVFDHFCKEYFPHDDILSRDIVMKWAERKQGESPVTHRIRLSLIRQFCKYMLSQGIAGTYVLPVRLGAKIVRRVPHFFTSKELQAFFSSIDNLPISNDRPGQHLIFPVLFRSIYCCGLRPFEARLLQYENVDLKKGVFTIRCSKGAMDRIILLSEDMLFLSRIYNERISLIFPQRRFFFPKDKVTPYEQQSLIRVFKESWMRAGLEDSPGTKPHIYDLRHHFALTNLNRWVSLGEDFNAKLPYLSRYMGHTGIESTDYYLHFVPEFFPVFKEKTQSTFNKLIPEVLYEKA